MKTILQLLRVKQWIKNFFVIIPFFISLKFLEFSAQNYGEAALSFIAFCLLSSAFYILNDIHDIEEDRHHARKKFRPITAGKVKISHALIITLTLLILAFFIIIKNFNHYALFTAIGYCAVNIAYNFKLKFIAILDVIMISIGFVLRVLFGIFCFAAPISKWILLLTFSLCLLIALTKRRQDYVNKGKRKSLEEYSIIMLDKFISMSAVLTISCYIMYANEMLDKTGNYGFLLTNIFVLFGVFRYLQAMHLETVDVSDSGIIIYKDLAFFVNLVLWGITLMACLILGK